MKTLIVCLCIVYLLWAYSAIVDFIKSLTSNIYFKYYDFETTSLAFYIVHFIGIIYLIVE